MFVLKCGDHWTTAEEWVSEVAHCYPYLDVTGELDKARVWLLANPSRRKTARGMPRFLVAWLNRADEARLREYRQLVRQQGPRYVNIGAWRDECERVHGGHQGDFCGTQVMHHARMQATSAHSPLLQCGNEKEIAAECSKPLAIDLGNWCDHKPT